ncbi:hypothetical protein HAX54_023349, partial [Datura stramonium]|nr:hypothetical protein [Datura stramonium]
NEMNPPKKSEMGSSSNNSNHTFLPSSALARGRGQSFRSMGSVRVSAEKRTLINQFKVMQETPRSKLGILFSKAAIGFYFDRVKDDTFFPHEDIEVM